MPVPTNWRAEPAFVLLYYELRRLFMALRFKQIKCHALELLGMDHMNQKFKVLALNYIFLMVYFTLESVFVNTLLYRITPEMSIVIYYRAVVYLVTALSMNLAAYLSKRFSPVTVIKLGALSYLIMYLVLFIGMDHMDRLMYVVAVLSGCSTGLYWCGHNFLITHYTSRENRSIGVSILGLVQGTITLLVPVLSGFVISLMPGNAGYRVMFGFGMLAVILQSGAQKRLAPVEVKKHTNDYRLAFKLFWHKTTCKLMLGYEMMRGFREGTFTFFLNMVLFEIITEESLVGINTFLIGVLSIAGSWAYGKLAVGAGRRIKLAFAATTLLLLFCAMLFVAPTAPTVMLFSMGNAFLGVFIMYSCNTYSYDVMGQNETTRQCLAEMGGIREVALTAGKLAGMFVVTRFPSTITGYTQAMCLLIGSQYLTAMMIKLTRDTLDRKQIKRMSAQH